MKKSTKNALKALMEKRRAFYEGLGKLVLVPQYDSELADKLAVQMDDGLIQGECFSLATAQNFLREAHEEYAMKLTERKRLRMFAGHCFSDLASFMRDRKVRDTIQLLQMLSGTLNNTLYLRVANVRPLDQKAPDDEAVPAVLTIVVNSTNAFNDWISENKGPIRSVSASFVSGWKADNNNPMP